MIEHELEGIISALNDIKADNSVPKNVKEKVDKAILSLESDDDMTTKVHKALQELDDLSDDTTMQSFTRTQIWNVVSCLESV